MAKRIKLEQVSIESYDILIDDRRLALAHYLLTEHIRSCEKCMEKYKSEECPYEAQCSDDPKHCNRMHAIRYYSLILQYYNLLKQEDLEATMVGQVEHSDAYFTIKDLQKEQDITMNEIAREYYTVIDTNRLIDIKAKKLALQKAKKAKDNYPAIKNSNTKKVVRNVRDIRRNR